MNRTKYLLKNTAIFTLGNLGTKFISFFMVPLYTYWMTTDAYGTVDLIGTIAGIVVPLLTLNVGEAVLRFALDKNADVAAIVRIGVAIASVASVLGLLAIPICHVLGFLEQYAIFISLFIMTGSWQNVCACILRGRELLLPYALTSIIQSVAFAGLAILTMGGLHWGIEGYLIAGVVANCISLAYSFYAGRVHSYLRWEAIDTQLMRQMLTFSVVLIPNSFMWWVMNSSDRAMLTAMAGLSVNGIYAVSCKVPMVFSNLGNLFLQAWQYSAIREDDSADRDEYSSRVFNHVFQLLVLAVAFAMLVIKPFLRIYVEPSYYEAWRYTPYLFIGVVFLTSASFLSASYTVHKDSTGFLKSGISGAIVNILLNFALIPPLGAAGAALATCLSYLAVFLYRAKDTRKYIHLRLFTHAQLLGIAVLVIMGTTSFLENRWEIPLLCSEFLLLCVAYRQTLLDFLRVGLGVIHSKR